MKKVSLLIVLLMGISLTTISCRESAAEEKVEIKTDDDASDPVENTIQEGVNEVKENTGTGGTDDN